MAEMKGNEARIVFFLHPVKEFRLGQVSKAEPKSKLPRLRSVLLSLGTLFVFGVLLSCVFFISTKPNKQSVPDFFTTAEPLESTTADADTPITVNITHATAISTSVSTTESEVAPTNLTTPTQTTPTTVGTAVTSTTTTTTTMTTTTTNTVSTLTTVDVTPTPGSQNLSQNMLITLPWPRHRFTIQVQNLIPLT